MRYRWIYLIIACIATTALMIGAASTENMSTTTNTPKECALTHNINDPDCTSAEATTIEKTSTNVQQGISEALSNPHYVEKLLDSENLLAHILLFTLIGALLSLTPCILPLIAILACIIAGESSGSHKISKLRMFSYIFTYVLTSSIVYGVIGYLAASFGVFLEVYIQSSILIYLFALIITFVAILLLRGKELTLLQPIQNKLIAISNQQKGGSYLGIIIMAILSTVIISPCVTAPIIGILSYIGLTGDITIGFVGLFFLGVGMGIPLLSFSLLSRSIFPNIAHLSEIINIVFGLTLLITALALIDPLIDQKLGIVLWGTLIIFITMYMGLLKKMKPGMFAKFWKTITIALLAYGIAMLLPAFITNQHLNPYNGQLTEEKKQLSLPSFQQITKDSELKSILTENKKTQKLVLLDFYASWCTACIKMDREVWTNPEVKSLLKYFILLRVDLTKINLDSISLARKFNIIGPPDIIFFDPEGTEIKTRIVGLVNAQQLALYLQSVLENHRQ